MTMPIRPVLFIDYQYVYRRARNVFFSHPQSDRDEHLKPMELGRLIAGRGSSGIFGPSLNPDPLDLVQGDLVAGAVVEPGGLG